MKYLKFELKSLIYINKKKKDNMKHLKKYESFLILEGDTHQTVKELNGENKSKLLNGVEFYVHSMNVLKGSDDTKLSGSKFKVKIVDAGQFDTGASDTITLKPKLEVSDIQLGENNEENEHLQGNYGMIKQFKDSSFIIFARDSKGDGINNELRCDYPLNSQFVIEAERKLIPALNEVFGTEFKFSPFETDKRYVIFSAK